MYQSRALYFVEWCAARGLLAMPAHPDVLRAHLQWLAADDQSWSTIKVSLAAVVAVHRLLGLEAPTSSSLRAAVRELRRRLASTVPKEAMPQATLKSLVATCTDSDVGVRDRALLLMMYYGNLTAGESSALNGVDVARSGERYVLQVRVKGVGDKHAMEPVELRRQDDLDMCPVRALDAWLRQRATYRSTPQSSARQGPLFVSLQGQHWCQRVKLPQRLSARGIRRVLQRRAAAAGIAPNAVSVHGLRAGAFLRKPLATVSRGPR
jgi:site-specific recombinase XerD